MLTQPSPTAPIDVRVVETDPEFEALGRPWEVLQETASVTSVFSTFDWQHLWWRQYGRGRPLKLLVARTDRAIVGILPLYVHTVPMLGVSVRQLRFVGTGGDTCPDDLGPVLAEGDESRVARALADSVLRLSGWDVLQLQDMLPDCAFTSAMSEAATRAGLDSTAGRSERIALMKLPSSWEEWLASLHHERRYKVRSARKKLDAKHSTRFFVWEDPTTLDQGIDRLVELHNKRWNLKGEPHGFSSPQYIAFHRAVMHSCMERDRLRLYCLEIDHRIAAISYMYKFRNQLFLMQSGFDPDLSGLSPGQVLLGHAIEHAIGEGIEVLDFLRGDHRYKEELATADRQTVFLNAFRVRPGAWAWRARRMYLPSIKRQVMQVFERVHPTAQGAP